MDSSNIQKFFKNKTIFLTGGTGFLGKVLIEKLLRTTQIQRIYVLVRPKAGKDINERIPHIFKDHLFEKLLKLHNDPVKYIKAIAGDCMLNNLGMTNIDRQELIENCDVIIHTAATVRFNEPLSNAISVNVQATVDLLNLAKEMKKLKAFVHVSSAFANCLDFHIEETYYTDRLGITAEELLKIKGKVNDAALDSMHSKLVNKFPNTYCYTKSVAEEAVLKLGNTLPICIFRPGIIIPTSNEPVPGWIDNLYGPTSIIYGGALGVLRVIYCRASSNAGLVPVDYCVNMIMAGAWHTATDITQIPSLKPPIYNLVPDESNTLKWTTYKSFVEGYGRKIPLASMIWYPFLLCTETYWIYKFLCFVYHTVPGYIIDTILLSMGRKRRMTRTYQKIHKTSSYLRYFTENSWTFDTSNTKYLWSLMNSQDQRLYNFDMVSFDWSQYAVNSLVGMRKYLAKEEPDTIPKAKKLMRRLYILNFVVHSFVCATFFWLLWTIFNSVFPST
ncbi:fatty acyl-CoA reductase wat-like isoform X1 [Glossina fuscipes]|uniref:Fatty acyl-CoA reductase n=1 Tax=Glossina fuscipes TaxID=7396 RepID=A0A8U0WJG8_9MUSC|nr:fatty acyl-CoA reductase wat-like isoform X1 [Glossina fuscipes]